MRFLPGVRPYVVVQSSSPCNSHVQLSNNTSLQATGQLMKVTPFF